MREGEKEGRRIGEERRREGEKERGREGEERRRTGVKESRGAGETTGTKRHTVVCVPRIDDKLVPVEATSNRTPAECSSGEGGG